MRHSCHSSHMPILFFMIPTVCFIVIFQVVNAVYSLSLCAINLQLNEIGCSTRVGLLDRWLWISSTSIIKWQLWRDRTTGIQIMGIRSIFFSSFHYLCCIFSKCFSFIIFQYSNSHAMFAWYECSIIDVKW